MAPHFAGVYFCGLAILLVLWEIIFGIGGVCVFLLEIIFSILSKSSRTGITIYIHKPFPANKREKYRIMKTSSEKHLANLKYKYKQERESNVDKITMRLTYIEK